MIRRPPRSTHCISSAASDVYKRQVSTQSTWGDSDLGSLSGIQATLYLPGIAKNDGFRIYQGFQNKSFFSNSYNFANFIRVPRGYSGYQNNKMYSLAIDYKFPICYPDFSIGKLAYIKRIKSSLFYDYAWLSMPTRDSAGKIYSNSLEMEMKSLGLELSSDLHVLRFFAPIEIGFRSVYLPNYGEFSVQFVVFSQFQWVLAWCRINNEISGFISMRPGNPIVPNPLFTYKN
eukprot:TRINITY_DN28813_c0_g1_i2.p1 TRINITY_DN28813_c0_g1~~TRINITY_DN28813_c0_g1_i2.p1  ORF type:complete len:231 (+),score=17.50 TRINITY_DN28813_c0_g1_i2:97-789(+)